MFVLCGASGKEPTFNVGDIGDLSSTPGSGRSPGGEHGNLLQYSYLENPVDRGAWQLQVTTFAPFCQVGNCNYFSSRQYFPFSRLEVENLLPISLACI